MPPVTRLAIPEDFPAILSMINALAAHHGDISTATLETLARDARGPVPWITLIVAEEGSALVGYAALCPLAQVQFGARGMDMHHLFVAKSNRGTGVGRALIDASIAQARSVGCRYVMVGTHPENRSAQAIYSAMGFELRPEGGPRFRIRL
jgi:GNAT superfamily N-acetyltransferase